MQMRFGAAAGAENACSCSSVADLLRRSVRTDEDKCERMKTTGATENQ